MRSLRDMNKFLPYDPGVLPSAPPPSAGESISFRVEGLPSYKDGHFSIRNTRHKFFPRFKALRQASIEAMGGRAPYRSAIGLDFVMHAQELEKSRSLIDYIAGIMDTLDGSHGCEFTYLPIFFEDDCQVWANKKGQSRIKSNFTLTLFISLTPFISIPAISGH